jgi:histidyl-tRNA synthetase
MASWPQPVKLYSIGPQFRYDRPQAGRQRQFWQLDVEILGEAAPSADAQVMMLANRFYKQLGLNLSLQVNSIGDAACRPKYKQALVEYFEGHRKQLCASCKDRLTKNPLRILDCKQEQCQPLIAGAPQMLNFLCKACQAHLTGVFEYLDDLNVAYELNHTLVRGLDYYTRTVFEFYGVREGAQASVGGGGRYDGLVELLGGQPTPAVGFGLGVERTLLEMETNGVAVPPPEHLAVYVASLGEPARLGAFRLIEQLLDGGVKASGAVDKDGIQGQLARANRLGVPYAIIIGQKEVFDGTVILRDMSSGAQEVIPTTKIVLDLQKRFNIHR